MANYYCHVCARKYGLICPVDPSLFPETANDYQLEKWIKHTAPTGIYPENGVFSVPDWNTVKDYSINTAASGFLEIDDRGRKNLIYFAGEETGLQYNNGEYFSPCSGIKLVLSENPERIHSYPVNFAPYSKQCVLCKESVPFDPRDL